MVEHPKNNLKHQIHALAQIITMQSEFFIPALNRDRPVRLLDYVVLLSCMVVLPAGVVHGLLGIDERIAFALVTPVVLCMALIVQNGRVHKSVPKLVLALTITGGVASAIAMSMSQLLMAAALAVSIVVGSQLCISLRKAKILRIVSYFTLALLVGGLTGIVYAAGGGTPLLEVSVGYRITYLYLTTFSFALIGDIIRPSGIFDEPGAFAMYVAILTIFNDTLRQNLRLNNVLIFLLLFTGSLAGFVITALYVLTSNAMRLRRIRNIILVGTLLICFGMVSFLAPSNPISRSLDTFYSDRIMIEDGTVTGDNRSNQLEEFFWLVDAEILRKGAHKKYEQYDIKDQSSHPLSIMFGYGVIIWIPYFLLLVWLIVYTIKNRFENGYACLGLFLLLLQRPYLYHMSWSVLIVATVWLLYTYTPQRDKWGPPKTPSPKAV